MANPIANRNSITQRLVGTVSDDSARLAAIIRLESAKPAHRKAAAECIHHSLIRSNELCFCGERKRDIKTVVETALVSDGDPL